MTAFSLPVHRPGERHAGALPARPGQARPAARACCDGCRARLASRQPGHRSAARGGGTPQRPGTVTGLAATTAPKTRNTRPASIRKSASGLKCLPFAQADQ